ncbi:hypothetical protein HanRHA438_Chr06g0256831 [Helianthus annuus]|nr:hypothetical protein HanRHA438_Chr06g0256821 [Helianthus annuus]KAJ0910852.1 hypothetical protein HanRHA438_Chr06g0256831 [Helianthus annuus]
MAIRWRRRSSKKNSDGTKRCPRVVTRDRRDGDCLCMVIVVVKRLRRTMVLMESVRCLRVVIGVGAMW